MKGAEGNFVKINLKKKSHVKGYALRGAGLRKQVHFVYVCVCECMQDYPHCICVPLSQKSEPYIVFYDI